MKLSVTSKFSNSYLLKKNRLIARNIPETRILTKPSLSQMLQHYRMVYVKPDNSCQGKGIIRVSRSDTGTMIVSSNDYGKTFHANHLDHVWNLIQKVRMKRPYIIQQGIDSLTKRNLLFDFRVHLVRGKKKWGVVGIAGRVASKHLIVTNYYDGVKYKPVMNLLTQDLHYPSHNAKMTVDRIKQISLQTTSTVSRKYPSWREFGIDIGIDRKGRIWIYEINIIPSALVFKAFSYPLYRRILKLRRSI